MNRSLENGWKKVKLGDMLTIKHGFAFKGEYFADKGEYLLLTPGNFNEEGGLKFKNEKEKYYSGDFPKEYLLKKNDLLIVMTDLKQDAPILGSAAFIPTDNQFLHNQRLGKIKLINPSEVDLKFLYFLLNSLEVRVQIKGSASGATVKHTSPERIYDVVAFIPKSLSIQRKIVSILSAYDDLIENNTRRLKILEEMAQAIYKEWFVNFRFPGHEKVKMVETSLQNRIPEGWEVKRLGELVELAYGKGLKKEERKEGKFPVYGSGGIVGCHDEYLVEGPGIIVGRKGNVGSVFWSHKDFYPIDTVFFVNTNINLHYVFYNFKEQNFVNNDAAVPGLSRNQAYSNRFLLPEADVLERFGDVIAPIFNHFENLQSRIENLRRTRDLLLSKLISGEIDVEELEIKEGGLI